MITVCEYCDTPGARESLREALAEAGVPDDLAARVEAQRFGSIISDAEDRFVSRDSFGTVTLTVGQAMTLLGALQETATRAVEERYEAEEYADRFGVPVEAVWDQDRFLSLLEAHVEAAEAVRAGDQRVTLEIPEDLAAWGIEE